MDAVFAILLLSLVVIYADYRLTTHNWGSPWNGIGAIPGVLDGASMAPMQYRVLVPWICALFGRGKTKTPYLGAYTRLRWVSIVLALAMSYIYFAAITELALLCTALLALYFVAASLFDYTDGYLEIFFFAFAFWWFVSGYAWWWLVPPCLIAGINRETTFFIPVIWLMSGDWAAFWMLLAASYLGYAIPRALYGQKKRYCSFLMIRENWQRIKTTHRGEQAWLHSEYGLFVVLLLMVAGAYLPLLWSGGMTAIEWSMGGLFIALLLPSIWSEIRVFGPVMLVVIPRLVQ